MNRLVDADVIVIGAGVAGCAAALALRRLDLRVTVIGHGDAYAGLRGLGILGGCPLDDALLPLAGQAAALWRDLPKRLGLSDMHRRSGHLALATDELEMTRLAGHADRLAKLDMNGETLDIAELHRRHPWCGADVVGGLWAQGGGRIDPIRLGLAYARAARLAGVDLREGVAVTGIDAMSAGYRVTTDKGYRLHGRLLVNAAGVDAAHIADRLGDLLPVAPRRFLVAATEPATLDIAATASHAADRLTLAQRSSGQILFRRTLTPETADGEEGHGPAMVDALLAAMRALARVAPRLSECRVVGSWTGREAVTPDRLPIIGESARLSGVFHLFGFGEHAAFLIPAAGEALAEVIANGGTTSGIDLAPFSPGRFSR